MTEPKKLPPLEGLSRDGKLWCISTGNKLFGLTEDERKEIIHRCEMYAALEKKLNEAINIIVGSCLPNDLKAKLVGELMP